MKVGSLFAGIGGFDLGFERAGFEVAWCVEIDRNARAVLARRFPKARILEDVTKVDPHDLETVDVICGGFPCQDLSVAGKRAGLAGARSGLFHDAMRIVRTLRPRLLVLENVPGLLSSNRGLDFASVLREVGEGWDCAEVAWRVLDSQYFGVAQRRRRVFIVGSARSGCAEEVLALAESSGGDPPSRGEAREGVAVDAARCADGGRWWDGSDLAATLTKQNANGGQRMPDKGNLGAVVQAYRWQNDRDGMVPDDIVGLRASAGASGFHEMNHPIVAQAFGVSEQLTAATDLMPTIQAVAHAFYSTDGTHGVNMIPELCPPLKIGSALGIPSPPAVCTSTIVRRLTPVECERLQGFPDGWTDIGTAEKPTADTHRYKQLGNAVTVNVAEWIARRAHEALSKEAR